eukprot:GEMP01009351.1.p1 GENE.GEMP01009351.1~~GEMP01009351.1.p1  ORF type:complete len:377 (+),score=56.13 GEMP01009351.1:268-1398(+)
MELVERVKTLQKGGYREQWAVFCDTYGNGTRDPGRHDQTFLAGFVTYIHGGGAPSATYSATPVTAECVNEVKTFQRQGFREHWASYCDAYGGGIRDPNRQDPLFCKRFVEGCRNGTLPQLYMDFQKQQYGQYGPPTGGFLGSFPVAPALPAFPPHAAPMNGNFVMPNVSGYPGVGVPPRPELVNQVKDLQRTGYRGAWAQFCDASGNKTRDPARYDSAFLSSFAHFVQSGAAIPESPSVLRMSNNSMDFPSYPSFIPGGVAPVQLPDNSTGMRLTINTMEFGHQLVDKVKSLQRAGFQQSWCLYCDQFGQRVHDPSRHTEDFLQTFVDNPAGPWAPKFAVPFNADSSYAARTPDAFPACNAGFGTQYPGGRSIYGC